MAAANESLATGFQRCRQSFEAVLTLLIDIEDSSRAAWEDEASRLRLWGANIGAAQSKASTSLDFRLRDADTVRLQIHKNLSNLDEALSEALGCLGELAHPCALDRNAKPPEKSLPSQSSSTTLSPRKKASLQSQEHQDSSSSDDEASAEDLQAAFDDVVSLINSLFRMTLYIRNPSRRDQLKHRDTSAVANYETFDVSHVENKFPEAVGSLTQRLGQANTVRRAILRYWERHHKKLAIDETVNDAATTAPLSESVATAFQPVQVEEEEKDTRSHFSGTSYMESLLGGESIRRPNLPEAGRNSAPFQCPICCYIVTVSGQREWMKHVFFDLQPYLCVFENCKTPLLLYENRRDWFLHVTKNHMARDISNPLLQHLQCPLCWDSIRSLTLIRRHLARHLEEIALFSLPNSLFGDETEMVDDDNPADFSSGEDAVMEPNAYQAKALSSPRTGDAVDISQYDVDGSDDPELAKASRTSIQEAQERHERRGKNQREHNKELQNQKASGLEQSDDLRPLEQIINLESQWAAFSPDAEDVCNNPRSPLRLAVIARLNYFIRQANQPWIQVDGSARKRSAAFIRVAQQFLKKMAEVNETGEEVATHSPPADTSSLGLDRQQIQEHSEARRASFRGTWEMHRGREDAGDNRRATVGGDDDSAGKDEEWGWDDALSENDIAEIPQPHRFRRIDSRPDLTSRPTMLSMALKQHQRAQESSVDKSAPIDDRGSTVSSIEAPRDPPETGGEPSLTSLNTAKRRSSLAWNEDDRRAANGDEIVTSDLLEEDGRRGYTYNDNDRESTRKWERKHYEEAMAYMEEAAGPKPPLVGLAESTSNVQEEKCYPRGGMTRLPKEYVNAQVLHNLGYAFEEEVRSLDMSAVVKKLTSQDSKTLVVTKALGRENINEVLRMSKEYVSQEDTAMPTSLSDYVTTPVRKRSDKAFSTGVDAKGQQHLHDDRERRLEPTKSASEDDADSPSTASEPKGPASQHVPATMHTSDLPQSRADSPRIRRKQMLSMELTDSLRENVLWKRRDTEQERVDAVTARDRLGGQERSLIQEANEATEKPRKEDVRLKEQLPKAEEEEEVDKSEEETELEERLFEEKVREKLRAAGYSDKHIEEVLQRKKREPSLSDREWAIDLSRPTRIKVNRKYLDPQTLNHFRLPWAWDYSNEDYIVIKKYIDHEFLDVLFAHTRMLREKRLIPSRYQKDASIMPRPVERVVKSKSQMYHVRSSSESRGTGAPLVINTRPCGNYDYTVRSDEHTADGNFGGDISEASLGGRRRRGDGGLTTKPGPSVAAERSNRDPSARRSASGNDPSYPAELTTEPTYRAAMTEQPLSPQERSYSPQSFPDTQSWD